MGQPLGPLDFGQPLKYEPYNNYFLYCKFKILSNFFNLYINISFSINKFEYYYNIKKRIKFFLLIL